MSDLASCNFFIGSPSDGNLPKTADGEPLCLRKSCKQPWGRHFGGWNPLRVKGQGRS